jgi:hypothetical protein
MLSAVLQRESRRYPKAHQLLFADHCWFSCLALREPFAPALARLSEDVKQFVAGLAVVDAVVHMGAAEMAGRMTISPREETA